MTPLSDIRLTIDFGDRRQSFFADALAELLVGFSLAEALARLCPDVVHMAIQGEGDSEGSPRQGVTNGDQNVVLKTDYETFPIVPRDHEGTSRDGTAALASYLADCLSDRKSFAFYCEVARVVPADDIERALVAALDVPRRDIRRSRAAYFTAIIKPHLAARERGQRTPL